MNKILITCFIAISLGVNAHADIKGASLNKISEKTSSIISNLIPGEGLTEVDITLRDNNAGHGNIQFGVLGVRDIFANDNTNFFTQFSLHTQEINNDDRFVGNFGLGYRVLNVDQSMMFGVNTFYDQDLSEDHKRIGFGLEAKASILDFNFNEYLKATDQLTVGGFAEQNLSGRDFNLSSQVPHMPWAIVNYNYYRWDNEKATEDTEGQIYALEMNLNPSLQLDISKDFSDVSGVDDEWNYRLTFKYPPQTDKPTLLDGATSSDAFVKKNMQATLKDKVRRNNNLVIEVQGAVVVTSK